MIYVHVVRARNIRTAAGRMHKINKNRELINVTNLMFVNKFNLIWIKSVDNKGC